MTALKPSLLKTGLATGLATLAIAAAPVAHAGEWTANASAQNNYIWRGLTQSQNEAAISGGIDYADDSGFYVGTWISNVSYAPDDVYSYEHDIYAGFSGEAGNFSYDVGYLYYNYDKEAEFDFGEIYGSIGFENFTLGLNILTNTEADEAPGQDFGFGKTIYAYADYGIEVGDGVEIGFHVGYHDGDFSEAFNGVAGDYFDFNVSIAKAGFSFMVSTTNLDNAKDDMGNNLPDPLDNDEVKFVVGYTYEIGLSK